MSAENAPFRSPELLNRDDSRLLIVDMQEKLLPVIREQETLLRNCEKLVRGAQILGVPVSATEQYPRGLGATVEPLRGLLGPCPEKLRFSCCGSLDWIEQQQERPKVVVAGIEAHVCVQQTVFDLLARGYAVYVPGDAISSRKEWDWAFAVQRMRDAGAVITSSEAVLFEWCEVAGTEEFKQISRLVREP